MTGLSFTQGQLDEGRIFTVLFNGLVSVSGIMGDVNGDQVVDLKDLALALRIMTETAHKDTLVNVSADVNNDNRIGIEEVMYILKEISRE